MTKEIHALIEKARRSLRAARALLDSGDFDFAVSRAYYAIFYVSEALLLNKGAGFSKHAAVIAGVYREYVKDGHLPRAFHRTLHRAFGLRQKGDYLSEDAVAEDEARSLVEAVEQQIEAAVAVLKGP